MAETTKRLRRRGGQASDEADQARAQVEEQSPEEEEQGGDERRETGDERRQNGAGTLTGELKDTVREAAIEVLKPVMRKATTSAAKYAVTKGPSLLKDKVGPRLEDAGGAAGIAKGVASKGGDIAGKFGKKEGKSPSGTGRGRRLPVQEFIDVGVDLQTAYDQFTQFEDWPQFMHRVERIEQRDDSTLMWHENIWGVRRSWEAEITEQTPCERIAWRSSDGPQTIGVVTFHRLSDRLTRIYITLDFQPKGLFEKAASGMRISRRALKSDLMRFKAFVELRDEATGEWRGRIEEGEVVDAEAQDGGEPEDSEEREEPRAGREDEEDEEVEDEEGYDDEPQASEEDEDEETEEPRESEDEETEEPRASEDEGEEEDEEEFEDAPRASADEDEEDEEEAAEAPPQRRSRERSAARRRAPASSGRGAR